MGTERKGCPIFFKSFTWYLPKKFHVNVLGLTNRCPNRVYANCWKNGRFFNRNVEKMLICLCMLPFKPTSFITREGLFSFFFSFIWIFFYITFTIPRTAGEEGGKTDLRFKSYIKIPLKQVQGNDCVDNQIKCSKIKLTSSRLLTQWVQTHW